MGKLLYCKHCKTEIRIEEVKTTRRRLICIPSMQDDSILAKFDAYPSMESTSFIEYEATCTTCRWRSKAFVDYEHEVLKMKTLPAFAEVREERRTTIEGFQPSVILKGRHRSISQYCVKKDQPEKVLIVE